MNKRVFRPHELQVPSTAPGFVDTQIFISPVAEPLYVESRFGTLFIVFLSNPELMEEERTFRVYRTGAVFEVLDQRFIDGAYVEVPYASDFMTVYEVF